MSQTIAFGDGHAPRTQSLLVMIGEKARCFLQCKMTRLALSRHSSRTRVCPLLDQSGQRWVFARDGLSAFDPQQALAVHCSNGFDAGFSPYQSARLSR
jgi:hypothetical protein